MDGEWTSVLSGVPRLRCEDVLLNPGGCTGFGSFSLGGLSAAGASTPTATADDERRRSNDRRRGRARLIIVA
ncbi:hypothetical protein DMJ13_01355 [halophilic archaeon]|nr:hypothetical protein DMJ13_01355 [halophilic archaeon]